MYVCLDCFDRLPRCTAAGVINLPRGLTLVDWLSHQQPTDRPTNQCLLADPALGQMRKIYIERKKIQRNYLYSTIHTIQKNSLHNLTLPTREGRGIGPAKRIFFQQNGEERPPPLLQPGGLLARAMSISSLATVRQTSRVETKDRHKKKQARWARVRG